MVNHDIIVIGASAGGVEALSHRVAQLPHDLPAAVFVVQHTAPDGPGLLAEILDRAGSLAARVAEDGEAIQRGVIYLAPPDQHLLVHKDRLRVARGPRENRSRPTVSLGVGRLAHARRAHQHAGCTRPRAASQRAR